MSGRLDVIEVDGSYGEGGGQILRTALSLSIILGRPIRVTKIRAGREVPGLRTQHAAVLRILRDLSGAALEGGHVGSTEVSFSPGRVESDTLRLDLGTAASITLVLQALVPAVSLSGASLGIEFRGGTDVPWSPTSDYFAAVVVPALELIGIRVDFQIARRGYYPRGGGLVKATIHSAPEVRGVDLSRGEAPRPAVSVVSRCARLPRHVAERQASSAASRLRGAGIGVARSNISVEESDSPGSSILVTAVGPGCLIGSDGLGARGRPAEQVGDRVGAEFAKAFAGGSTVDSHLADMLVPLLSLAKSESRLLVPRVTDHLKTSLYVSTLFTGCEASYSPQGDAQLVVVRPGPVKGL